MRRRDVAKVERRVLAHQDDVDVLSKIEDSWLSEAMMVANHALDGNRIAHRPQAAFGEAEILRSIRVELMSERLRLEHDRKGQMANDIDPLERVPCPHGDAKVHDRGRLREGFCCCHPRRPAAR